MGGEREIEKNRRRAAIKGPTGDKSVVGFHETLASIITGGETRGKKGGIGGRTKRRMMLNGRTPLKKSPRKQKEGKQKMGQQRRITLGGQPENQEKKEAERPRSCAPRVGVAPIPEI